MPEKFFTLSTVTRRVEELLRPAINARFWIKAEISSGKERGGSFYCDLIETDDAGGVRAQMRCTIWGRELQRIRRRFGGAGLELALESGALVGIECRVQFHPRYGLSLSGLDMDPAVALGELELKRRRILESLTRDGLLERNRALPVPLLPVRIGLITSAASAAYRDLTETLLGSGFGIRVFLADTAVQGPETGAGVLRGLDALEALGGGRIVIARGGGSKTDLAWLDDEAIARRVAACSIPVWTGIGHETDTSVLDVVAGLACKTPTAVGEELVGRFESVEGFLRDARGRLRSLWSLRSELATDKLRHWRTGLSQGTRKLLDVRRADLRMLAEKLRGDVGERLQGSRERLMEARLGVRAMAQARVRATAASLVALRERLSPARVLTRLASEAALLAERSRGLRAADPATALTRGFSLTYTSSGRLVRSITDLETGQATLTRVADGQIEGEVRKIIEGEGNERDEL